ncbi:bifunctional histidine phosphatase family protein/GNAT family N-acetyltransferase [Papillibacter cinnamivorans]|uniref:Probable phosphoglycerate mutase n=1 Tax=Papillibacter cinnamivorans DSM 12816 TaxID=1122930 RepID=A0A1W2BWV0_9FIRM|nr:bifunctional histidine phosphatase family protein/GNAT family N-acetyltransferase [Papillibacter cinnamivorans]SMC77381.1 probable phosphoglycerate mutase [Papillibacter cinnamivorans DSM 12816]
MTKVYLIRHAEAEGNLYRRIHGHYDSLVTENGKRQIEALRRRFASIPVDAVYSSDLTRTRTTAEAIYIPRSLTLTTKRELREIHMGSWEDKTWGEVVREDPESMDRFVHHPLQWGVPGSESFLDMQRRMARSVSEIAERHPDQTVAVFSHGTAIRSVLCHFSERRPEEVYSIAHSDNTGVSLLEFHEGKARIVYQNDNSHLDQEISTFARQKWWKNREGEFTDQNLWYRPLDPGGEAELYLEARRDAWELIHGSTSGFSGRAYLEDALSAAREDPGTLLCAMLGDEAAGILQMDLFREGENGVGGIPFYYMKPKFRGAGLGVQLIGQAVSMSRPRGKSILRLRVAPENARAVRFYEKYGFRKTGEEAGLVGTLYVMEKAIGYGEGPNPQKGKA